MGDTLIRILQKTFLLLTLIVISLFIKDKVKEWRISNEFDNRMDSIRSNGVSPVTRSINYYDITKDTARIRRLEESTKKLLNKDQ